MKTIIPLFYLILFSLHLSAQEAQFGQSGPAKLVWPFDNSFYISPQNSSHGWRMICGPGCGLHRNSDYYALDWSRASVSACGAVFNAPLSGTVICTSVGNNTGYGYQIIIQSEQDSNYAFRMAHMQEVWVTRGAYVKAGEPIGRVGDTGNGGCHGHLAVYKNIYDQADGNGQNALHHLSICNFVPTPYDDAAYFSQPFDFVRGDGLKGDLSLLNNYEVAREDSLYFKVRVFNPGLSTWEGSVGIQMQRGESFDQGIGGQAIVKTDKMVFEKGDTLEVLMPLSMSVHSTGEYTAFLVFYSEEFSDIHNSNVQVKTPLRSKNFRLSSRQLCNLDEPNDEASIATPLFAEPLSEKTNRKKRTDFISVFNDEKDVFTFSTTKSGRMKIKFPARHRYELNVFDQSGPISLSNIEDDFSFLTSSGSNYFIEFSGRASCGLPYEFDYQWEPINDLVWTINATDQLNNEFIVLSAAEVEWKIFDLMGRELFSSGVQALEKGEYFFTTKLDNMISGVYLAALFEKGRFVEQRKFYWK